AAAAATKRPPKVVEKPDAAVDQEISASCPICIEPFKNSSSGKKVARVLSCGHLVCTNCVSEYRKQKRGSTFSVSNTVILPCVVCQVHVNWMDVPECKAVGLYHFIIHFQNIFPIESKNYS
ncbi:hypothetical protein PFISCL1PPCAC_7668, partial [Pristionchus fissidentatus]